MRQANRVKSYQAISDLKTIGATIKCLMKSYCVDSDTHQIAAKYTKLRVAHYRKA